MFINPEKTRSFNLHIESALEILPCLGASGHHLYVNLQISTCRSFKTFNTQARKYVKDFNRGTT